VRHPQQPEAIPQFSDQQPLKKQEMKLQFSVLRSQDAPSSRRDHTFTASLVNKYQEHGTHYGEQERNPQQPEAIPQFSDQQPLKKQEMKLQFPVLRSQDAPSSRRDHTFTASLVNKH
jgi:hypothetical protein